METCHNSMVHAQYHTNEYKTASENSAQYEGRALHKAKRMVVLK